MASPATVFPLVPARGPIQAVTGVVLALAVALCAASINQRALLVAGALLVILSICCYLLAPVAYEIRDGELSVCSRARRKTLGTVKSSSRLAGGLCGAVRLWGNGGMFAFTGLFWSKPLGRFWIYATSARAADLVVVETTTRKVVVSPANAEAFLAACRGR